MRFLSVGEGKDNRNIAVLQRDKATENDLPGLFWLGGFKSDMSGSKAQFIDGLAEQLNTGATRFDYSGHGQSEGNFLDGTISRWLEEALAVFQVCTIGPQIIIGSSMGGWLAFLLNQRLREKGIDRVKSLIVIAPAIDMTEDLMRDSFSPEELEMLETKGRVEQPSDYEEPYVITKKLIDDGAQYSLFSGAIKTSCPVHILQGGQDMAVPPEHAQKLVSHLLLDPVTLSMVPDGDHSLSRESDLALLKRAILVQLGDQADLTNPNR